MRGWLISNGECTSVTFKPAFKNCHALYGQLEGVAPRLVQVTTLHGRPYMAIEYVFGKTLRNSDVSVDQIYWSAYTLFANLQALHDREYVHTDIKPGNVVLTTWLELKLIDYCGAVKFGDRAPRWQVNQFASPEFLLNQPLTAATDQYSAARCLMESIYTKLTGVKRTPYQISLTPPSYPQGCPEDIWEILCKAGSLQISERYSSCEEVADALECAVCKK